MAEDNFSDFIARERARLDAEYAETTIQIRALEGKLAAIQQERVAVSAYETAKSGKSAARGRAGSNGQRQTRRGSKRDELMQVIRDGNGLSRGDILEKMGLKGNKAGEMSVSNALTALTKNSTVRRDGGKYFVS